MRDGSALSQRAVHLWRQLRRLLRRRELSSRDSSAFCGTGGGLCVPCGSGQTCDGGHCVCTTGSCPGCCDDTICRAGTNAEQCGTGGGVCLACGVDQPCDSGHCANCGPSGTTCPTVGTCCTNICSCGNVNNPEANRCHGTSFSQTFASTVAGWYDFDPSTGIVPGTPTTIERQGTGAIVHAGSTYEGDKTAFTLWGGYSATFPRAVMTRRSRSSWIRTTLRTIPTSAIRRSSMAPIVMPMTAPH